MIFPLLFKLPLPELVCRPAGSEDHLAFKLVNEPLQEVLLPKLWQYGLWRIQGRDKNYKGFFPKHDHISRKNSYLEKWISMD